MCYFFFRKIGVDMLQDEFELRSSNSSGLAHSASVSTLEKSGRKKIPVEITVTHNSSF
jgi:hypothetical protein